MKRSPLKRKKSLREYHLEKIKREGRSTTSMNRSKLKPMSAKRRAKTPARKACRLAVYARCGGRCEAKTPDCTGFCEQVHEIKARSAGGSITDPANCLGTCAACHEWIQLHHNEARERGLVAPRGA